MEKLTTLRRADSELEGHPTPRFLWTDVATGSLGQGLSIGTGMALAARQDGLDYRTFVLLGDDETTEGAVREAAALASHNGLDNLVGIIDVNRLGPSQETMYGHDVDAYARPFEAFGWYTISMDGHELGEILSALDEAEKVSGRPVMIVARTIKGKGVPSIENENGWHGKPLDEEAAGKALAGEDMDVHPLAVRELPRSGSPAELLDGHGIGSRAIVETVNSLAGKGATRSKHA